MNALFTIQPYWHGGTWVFDDATTGLVREPFVAGVPQMIDVITADIPGARGGFRLTFSGGPFPGAQACLLRKAEEADGNWYRWDERNMEGWLCPAMFKYFDLAPDRIYLKAEHLEHSDQVLTMSRSDVAGLLALLDVGDVARARSILAALLR